MTSGQHRLRVAAVALVLLLGGTGGLVMAGGSAELEMRPLAEGVYVHTSYKDLPGIGPFPSNGLVVVRGRKALLIDTAWPLEATPQLLQWIEEKGYELDHVLVTHFHDDRSSGLPFLHARGVSSFASARTNTLLKAQGETRAQHGFEDGLPAHWREHVSVYFPGAGHSVDNHVVWLPEQGILFGGCLVRNAETQSMGNTADAELRHWAGSIRNLLERFPAARIVVPGHGAPGGPELLQHTLRLAEQHAE